MNKTFSAYIEYRGKYTAAVMRLYDLTSPVGSETMRAEIR